MKRFSLRGLNISSLRKDSSNDDNLTSNEPSTTSTTSVSDVKSVTSHPSTASAASSASSSASATGMPIAASLASEDADGDSDQGEADVIAHSQQPCSGEHTTTSRRPRSRSAIYSTLNTLRRKLTRPIRGKSDTALGKDSAAISGSVDNVHSANNCQHRSSHSQTLRRHYKFRWLPILNSEKVSRRSVSERPVRAALSDKALAAANSSTSPQASGQCEKCYAKAEKSPSSTHNTASPQKCRSSKQMVLVDTEYGHASAPIVEPAVTSASRDTAQRVLYFEDLANWNLQQDNIYGPAALQTALRALQPVYDEVRGHATAAPGTGRLSDGSWSLTSELVKLSNVGWYWGPITRVEAEEKLSGQVDGAFLVRDSSDSRHLLSLSFRSYSHTLHTRIEHCNGVFSFYAIPDSDGYGSIVDLIEHSMSDSRAGVFCYSRARQQGAPSFPVRLTRPVSRFSQVRTLQYLCRFVIRQYTRLDHIQRLPLPGSIKGWLKENQY